MQELRANTEVIVIIGPFVDVGDGFTPETGISLSTADEAELLKHGSTTTVDISAATWAAVTSVDGHYGLTLTTSHTDTEGMLTVVVQDDSVCLPVKAQFMVLAEAAWDSKYIAKDDGFMDVNIKTIGRSDTQETEANNLESACSNYSATRGLSGTALPAAAADAAGGLPISDAGGLDLDAILADTADMQPKLGTFSDLGSGATLSGNLEDMRDNGTAAFDRSTDSLQAIRDRGDAAWTTGAGGSNPWTIASGTIGSTGNDTTHVHLTGLTFGDDEIAGLLLVLTDVSASETHSRWIESWALTGALATVTTLPFTPQDATDTYAIVAVRRDVDATRISGDSTTADNVQTCFTGTITTLDALDTAQDTQHSTTQSAISTAQTDITAILADTNELQGDWVNGGRLDLIIDAILVDTAEIGAAGAGLTEAGGTGDQLTAIPWNAAWDAEVQSEVDDGLVARGLHYVVNTALPTGWTTDVTANSALDYMADNGTAAFDRTTDSLQAVRDRGDSAWITATGFSTHSAADVWAAATRTLTAATNITSDASAITMSSSGVVGTVNLVNTTTTNTDMRGTDSAALASVCTEARLAELDAANIPTDLANIEADTQNIQGRIPTVGPIEGTADSGTTTTMVDAARTEADTDYWAGSWIVFTSGTISGQARLITGFTPASDTITFTPATTQAVGTNTYRIVPAAGVTLADGVTHGGTTALLRLGSSSSTPALWATNSGGSAVLFTSSDVAGHGMSVTATGGGRGLNVTSVTGNALHAESGTGKGAYFVGSDGAYFAGSSNSINAPNGIAANITGNITGNLSGSVGSVTGSINTSGGTITTLDALDTAQDTQHSTTQSAISTAQTDITAILADTNELQGDWVNGGRLDLLIDAIKVITDALGATAAARLALSAGQMVPGTVDNSAHTPTTTEFEADDITEATADHYICRIVIFTSGALAGQATDITDYALSGANGHFTVTALTEAPANDVTFLIV